jgi:hypothetical protein
MEFLRYRSLEFITENHEQNTLLSDNDQNLSENSLDILDSILKKRVTIIFSQGSLNITPLVACIYAELDDNSVIIGIPRHIFQKKYHEYTKVYFSLLYKSYSVSFFFYRDILWGKGKIDEEKNELSDLIIEKYPAHGIRDYKKIYEETIRERLKNSYYNDFEKFSKIITIPIDYSIPSNILGQKAIHFKEEKFELDAPNPDLIILESINERNFKFDNLIQLIKKTKEVNTKLVLHFSWPYLRGLDDFLSDPEIKNNEEIEIFHFGKRFCIELKKKFKKPPFYFLPLSLEGKLWDTVYYPTKIDQTKISVITHIIQSDTQKIKISDLFQNNSLSDRILSDIRNSIDYENMPNNFTKNILKFPAIIDSFLLPSEIKVRDYIEKIKAVSYITIQDFLKFRIQEDSHSFQSFQSLCSDLESCKDISRELRGLRTYSAMNKKTLFQVYLIDEIQKVVKKYELAQIGGDSNEEIDIIIPKLHPFFETRKNNIESLQYFFQSFPYLLNQIKRPNIIKKSKKIVLKAGTNEITLFGEEYPKNLSQEKIHEIIDKERIYPLEVSITKESGFIEIFISIKIQIPFVRIEKFNEDLGQKEYCRGLDIYHVKITPDGQYLETYLSVFSNENNFHSNSLNYKIKYITTSNSSSKTHQIHLNIDLIELSSICHISQEKIAKSRLLMPGPIPFQIISNGELFISQGYDALLMPFKEIVFFAFPGKNLQRIFKQIRLCEDLLSEKSTRISDADLLYSIEHMKKSKRYEFPQKPVVVDSVLKNSAVGDTIFDAAVRSELLDESRASEDEKEEIITLKEIWKRVGKKKPMGSSEYQKVPSEISSIQRDQIILKIKFDDNTEDNISFMSGTLIRKRSGDDFVLAQVNDLSEGDEIIYIGITERMSVDNFLLRDFAQDKGISLEQIYEPFKCLRHFYEILNSIDYLRDYPADLFKKMYWLNDTQNLALFKTIQILTQNQNLTELDDLLHDTNNIWAGQLSSDQLTQTFTSRRNQITYEKLFKLVQFVGFSLAKDTFKQYCTFAINEHQHYYFKNDKDLLALGRLIGYQRIIDDYEIINSQGREVGTILQIIGCSIARVSRGISDQFSEMDASIEGKVQRCTIIAITFPGKS